MSVGTPSYFEWIRRQNEQEDRTEERKMPGWIWTVLAVALAVFILMTM